MAVLCSCSHKSEEADLIIHNAVIYTMDPMNTIAEAMAVKDGVIIEIGAEYEILNKYSADLVYDAQMQPVYPGFIDAHCHFLAYGLDQFELDLKGTMSITDMLERVQQYAATNTEEWIVGRGWNHELWTDPTMPDKEQLDQLFPNTPVYLSRVDGHAVLVNQKALDLAGITTDSKFSGGTVEIIDGQLTGILIDEPADLVAALIPEPTENRLIQALQMAEQNCFEVGLTTVDDAGLNRSDIELIDELHRKGELSMRIYAMISDNKENLDYYLEKGPYQTDRLNVRSFKFYADGALGSLGACLIEAYSDSPDTLIYGKLRTEFDHLELSALKLYQAGFQMNTHCIGDSANRLVLDLYGRVLGGVNDDRWRIEHCQVIHPDDYSKFLEYTIIPSVQPTHATSDMFMAVKRLGNERVADAYAYQKLVETTGMVALGTDFPVEDINPLGTFYAAVTRKNASGEPENGWQMENALSREDALRGMTIWAAIANFEENEKGTIEIGKLADFVILNYDILKVEERKLKETYVTATFVNGELVYEF